MVGLNREEIINSLRNGFNIDTSLRLISDYCISKGKKTDIVEQLITFLSQNTSLIPTILKSFIPDLIRQLNICKVLDKQNNPILYY